MSKPLTIWECPVCRSGPYPTKSHLRPGTIDPCGKAVAVRVFREREALPPRCIVGNEQVRKLCGGIQRHTLLAWRRDRGFPAPIRTLPGKRRTELWDVREVRAWIRARNAVE